MQLNLMIRERQVNGAHGCAWGSGIYNVKTSSEVVTLPVCL